MTLQTLLDRMALYDNELDIVSGGADVTRGIAALNLVQDWWEAAAMVEGEVCQTTSTLSTTASQEYTTRPTTLLRIDSLWRLDANSVPIVELTPIDRAGAHQPRYPWPFNAYIQSAPSSTGAPDEYWAEKPGNPLARIYWLPKPDAVYVIRGYGLWEVADYTAAANTFGYANTVALALVPFAAKILRTGLDRDITDVQTQAEAAFRVAVKGLGRDPRVDPASRVYSEIHTE